MGDALHAQCAGDADARRVVTLGLYLAQLAEAAATWFVGAREADQYLQIRTLRAAPNCECRALDGNLKKAENIGSRPDVSARAEHDQIMAERASGKINAA
jgi:hypothetical protein